MSDTRYFAEGRHREKNRIHAEYNASSRINLQPILQRWLVVESIFDPTIINDKKISQLKETYTETPIINLEYVTGRELPRNSILARKVINIADGDSTRAEQLMFLYPFFPSSLALPSKPGEHVWVMFEHLTDFNTIGYWMCGIVAAGHVEDVNHSHFPRNLESSFIGNNAQDIHENIKKTPRYHFKDGNYFIQDRNVYVKALTESSGSLASVYESVPRFKKRPGDIALEGSNNTLIVLGRDRTGSAVKYLQNQIDPISRQSTSVYEIDKQDTELKKFNAGSIDIVAGRGQKFPTSGYNVINDLGNNELAKHKESIVSTEGDPDFINDRSRIYVSQKTEVDKNFEIDDFNSSNFSVTDDLNGDASIVIKTDKIRLIARSDVEILVKGFKEAKSTTNDNIKEENNQSSDSDKFAAVIIKSNGDIVFKPSQTGFIKLGDDTADKAILCTDQPAVIIQNQATFNPGIKSTGADVIGTGALGQGTFASKVLVK